MKKKLISALLCTAMTITMLAGCSGGGSDSGQGGGSDAGSSDSGSSGGGSEASADADFAGEELSILVSAGWMDNRYDDTIARFEETYDVTVDLQTIPADQYSDILQSKLSTDSCADIFWIQSNPFAIRLRDRGSGKILYRLFRCRLEGHHAGSKAVFLRVRRQAVRAADLA